MKAVNTPLPVLNYNERLGVIFPMAVSGVISPYVSMSLPVPQFFCCQSVRPFISGAHCPSGCQGGAIITYLISLRFHFCWIPARVALPFISVSVLWVVEQPSLWRGCVCY